MEHNKLLSPHATGFRRSCLDCLARLITHIQLGFTKNYATLACFLDIEGAYNNIIIDRALTILDRLKVGANICLYLWEYLKERHLQIKSDEENNIVHIRWTSKGIAQGDPISPLLFNLATIDICRNIKDAFIGQYADDLCSMQITTNFLDFIIWFVLLGYNS